MRIVVNGVPRGVGRVLSYSEVVRMAGITGRPTVVFTRGEAGHSGSMGPGDTVKVAVGMIFNVGHTGSA